ncbi:Conserved_hypothetical protein [Hexamita inflata]|uniref:Uncharacterized protein n=1 Tax=Hexamita inflata TaxID=28002 RepID=A0AA86PM63_9EUKA|nr:Conserved hypothetical protein [Hexamita inflata]
MPVAVSNPTQVLLCLAEHVIRRLQLQQTPEQLIADPYELNQYVNQVKVDWRQIAAQLNQSRDQIYHWYQETHLRSLCNRTSKEEKELLKQELILAIQSGEANDPDFQQKLKQKVFGDKNIHRSEFSIIFNNLKRSKEIQNEMEIRQINLGKKAKSEMIPTSKQEELVSVINYNTRVKNIFKQDQEPTHQEDELLSKVRDIFK